MADLHLKASAFPSLQRPLLATRNHVTVISKNCFYWGSRIHQRSKYRPPFRARNLILRIYAAISTSEPLKNESLPNEDEGIESERQEEQFDWYAHWYPIVPVRDLDKRRPHGKKVLGIDVVIWWDRNESAWKVFEDSCPHRLAPLSEGRIDQWGRLQCVYHGWCFGGAGDCKFIPQAPRDGPPIHTSKRACVAVFPSCVQNGILWFWPNSDPLYKDVHSERKPHYIPELDDPSFTNMMICRDMPYGYELLIENLMDPAHVPYAHYGIMRVAKTPQSLKADREGGRPLDISVQKLDINGFTAKQLFGENFFIPPCLYYGYLGSPSMKNDNTSSAGAKDESKLPFPPNRRALLIFYCVPVSPGNSRLIFTAPRNFAVWIERVLPRWMFHIGQNLLLDSDLYLLHVEEKKLIEVGALNWNKSCFVPTKADAFVVAFRRWLNKYGGTQVDWRSKHTQILPHTPPPREQLFDRYWTHTVSCSSCSSAHKALQATNVALHVVAFGLVGIVAAVKQSGVMSVALRYSLVAAAVICFMSSKWLSHFIYRTFRYHDYDHAFR